MIDEENMDRDTARALYRALDLTNLGVIAPHKEKYYLRYDINWLINAVKDGTPLTYVTFWHEGEKYKNNVFSQWYKGNPFVVNGRTYVTAEQYMMSEKALLFNDFASYQKIMNEPDPAKRKKLGNYNYIYSKNSDVFHKKDCPIALSIHNPRGCIYYNSVGKRRPCKLCNPQPDIPAIFKAAIDAIPLPEPPKPAEGPNFKEVVTERLLGGQISHVRLENLVGCCHNIIHPGKMTKRMLEEHRCIEKECTFFEKYEEYPYWVNLRRRQNEKRRSKLHKKEKKALADAEAQSMTTIRDALRECVPEEESQLDIIRVERIADRHYRVFFVSDNRSPDGGDFSQFAKLAREQFPWWRLQMRHIKNIDGSFVTREEYHAKHR